MKREILFILLLIGILVGGAAFHNRHQIGYAVTKVVIPQMTRVNGDANAVTATTSINGAVRAITCTINNNTGNQTATVALSDSDSVTLFTSAAFPENANTMQNYMTVSDANVPLEIYCDGTITVTATPSGDPGTSGMTIDVRLYCE